MLASTNFRDFDTDNGAFVFPTTTPIDFDPPAAHVSIDRIMSLEPERVFLTHFSEVGDLGRLAGDMHRDIDAFAAIAEAHEHDDDRGQRIADALFGHLATRLRDHGCTADREALWPLLEMDVKLNAQGLDVWLKRRAKARG